jgi:hypothetical protein
VSQAQLRAIREQMIADGLDRSEIVDALQQTYGSRPRLAWRLASGFTQGDVADRLCQITDDAEAGVTAARISEYEKWPIDGGRKPAIATLVALALVYETDVLGLIDDADRAAYGAKDHLVLDVLGSVDHAIELRSHSSPPDELPDFDAVASDELDLEDSELRAVLARAADRSSAFADIMREQDLGQPAMEELFNDVRELAREHLYINSFDLLMRTLRLQERVLFLLSAYRRPRQAADLHLFAALTTCLLADTSASAGFLDLADQQAEAAAEYAGAAGHDQLRFWVDGNFRSSLANWRGAPQSALDRLNRSRGLVSGGTSQLQLANSEALYLARLGRSDEALAAATSLTAHRSTLDGRDQLYDEIGGMFAYPEAKQEQTLAQTYLYLGRPEQAEVSATRSLELYRSAPPNERAFGNEAAASIDLARARLELGDVAAAMESLGPIFALEPRQRQQFVVLRLVELRNNLETAAKPRSRAARDLVDQIATFTSETATDVISRKQLDSRETGVK